MSQQSVLGTYFAIATHEQIAQCDEREWALLHNKNQAQQTFKEVSAMLHAEELVDLQRKNSAKRSREYHAQPKASSMGSRKQVSKLVLVFIIAEHAAVDGESDIQGHETIDIDVIETEAESDVHSNEFGHSGLELE